MKVLLCQIDGKIPNLALMQSATHHKALGDTVELSHGVSFERRFWDSPDLIYASAIFLKSRPAVERLLKVYPGAKIGGTGWDIAKTLESEGITTRDADYSLILVSGNRWVSRSGVAAYAVLSV